MQNHGRDTRNSLKGLLENLGTPYNGNITSGQTEINQQRQNASRVIYRLLSLGEKGAGEVINTGDSHHGSGGDWVGVSQAVAEAVTYKLFYP